MREDKWTPISARWNTNLILQTDVQRVVFNRAYNGCINVIRAFQLTIYRTISSSQYPSSPDPSFGPQAFWDPETQKEFIQMVKLPIGNNLQDIIDFAKNAEFKFLGWKIEEMTVDRPAEPLLRFRKGPPAQPNKSTNIEKHRKT
jgi:hypothetical protein